MAQCFEHLNATARAYLPMIDEGIAEAISRGMYGEEPFRYNLIGRVIARSMEPPARLRFKAPQAFQPVLERPRRLTMPAFRAYQIQYIDRLRQANGLDLARGRVRSPPPYSWIPLPLGCAFAFTTSHERRHLWQARQILHDPAFPR